MFLILDNLKFCKNFNDNIHRDFFSLFWLPILSLPALLQKKITFSWKWSVLQTPDLERTNQSTGICLRLGLPCNNNLYLSKSREPNILMKIGALKI